MKNNDIIINFGIGLGYLLDESFNNYPSKIYVYEPDLNLLHFVLSNVDNRLSGEIQKQQSIEASLICAYNAAKE